MAYTKNASPFFVAYINDLAPTNKNLKWLDPSLPPISPSSLSFSMCWLVLAMSSRAKSCSKSNVLIGKASYFHVVLFIDSKWRLFIFQSTWGLCKMSHDNPMMIGFVRDEMTLKTTLLLCDPIVTVNTLVSCVKGPKERFWPSIILITIGVAFSTNAKLCCHTHSLSMKYVDAP